MHFKSTFFAALLLLGAAAALPAAPLELDMQEAVRLAVTKNPAVLSAAADVRAGRARVVETRAPLEPDISLTYDFTRALNPLGPPFATNFGTFQAQPYFLTTYRDGLNLTQILYDGQKTASLVRQQKNLAKASDAAYLALRQSTAYNAIAGFYGLAVSREFIKVSEENLKNAQEHFNLAQARYKAGVAPRSDVILAAVPVANARLNLTQARQSAETAEASLDRILGLDVTTSLQLETAENLSFPVATEQQAYQTALTRRYEIRQAESQAAAAKAQLDAAHAGFLPTISAVAAYGYTDYRYNVLPRNLGYDYGLQASVPIFEGNLQSGQVAEAKALYDKSLSSLDAAKQDVLLDVRQSFTAFQSAKQSVEQAQTALGEALENLRAQEGEYKAGLVPILNLSDAQASALQAAVDELQARLNYQTATARLLLSMGVNLEDLHDVIQTP